MVRYGMVRYGMVRYGMVRYGTVRYGTVWCYIVSFSGEKKYDLMDYWNSTGLSGEEIVATYQKVSYDHLALLYNEVEENGGQQPVAAKKVREYKKDKILFDLPATPDCSVVVLCGTHINRSPAI